MNDKDHEIQENNNNEINLSTLEEFYFLLFGMNVLMAYNTFINGIDFFSKIFPQSQIASDIARVYNIAASFTYFISLPFIERFSVFSRFVFSSSITLVLMILLFFASNLSNPNLYFILILMGLIAITCAILFGTTMGYSGLFGVKATSMATSGLALGGLYAAANRIFSKFLGKVEGWYYLGSCILINLLSLIIFFIFQNTNIAKERIKFSKVSTDFFDRISRISIVFKKVWDFILEAALCMIITLTIFPGYASKIKSKHGLEKWSTTIVITSYMIGDFLGRIITRWYSSPLPELLWLPHTLRLLFFPFFLLSIQKILLNDDFFIYILTFLLAITGGYYLTLCITYTSQDKKLESNEIELAVFCVSLFLNIGIFIGSLLTYLMP